MTTGAAAAAVGARELERTLDAFRLADATAPDRARSPDQLGLTASRSLTRLIEAGVIQAVPGKNAVYLSEAALVAYRRTGAKRAALAALVAGVVMLIAGLAGAIVATRHR
jgi:hypothetical protein